MAGTDEAGLTTQREFDSEVMSSAVAADCRRCDGPDAGIGFPLDTVPGRDKRGPPVRQSSPRVCWRSNESAAIPGMSSEPSSRSVK